MTYGVFTSEKLEIAQTKFWAICLYCNDNKTIIGARLYNGTGENKTLVGICERNMSTKETHYAYEDTDGSVHTNNKEFSKIIGSPFNYAFEGMKKIDDIEITEPFELSTVAEAGIKTCLKQWRMGTVYRTIYDGMLFLMVTNKIEYVFTIQNKSCDIYCGASVNVPCENGMLGSGQYFRLRNFGDNSQSFCGFRCDLGNDIAVDENTKIVCSSGKCEVTPQGLFWPLKKYSDDEIILEGCGGDEYRYVRTGGKSEYFKEQ